MKHVTYGAEILELAESLHKHIPTVLYHHEWYNGEGYPEGLQGSEIPLFAAIIAIADAYDAITSFRPYKFPRTKSDAIQELKKYRGKQFDPKITDVFIAILHAYEDNTQKLLSKYETDHVFIMKNH
jgi:HD-GYP domain-containing protein (c-di-GMP phosphodiesterase class II)